MPFRLRASLVTASSPLAVCSPSRSARRAAPARSACPPSDLMETAATEGLKGQAQVDAKVSCDGRWKASKPGEVFQCQAETGDGRRATVEVTITDTEGNINWKVR